MAPAGSLSSFRTLPGERVAGRGGDLGLVRTRHTKGSPWPPSCVCPCVSHCYTCTTHCPMAAGFRAPTLSLSTQCRGWGPELGGSLQILDASS